MDVIVAQVTHFHQSRLPNLPVIVRALSTQVDRTVIYNQDIPFEGILAMANVIQAERNWGAQGTYFGTRLLPPSDYVLFHDNDVVLSKNAVSSLKQMSDAHPEAIIVGSSETHIFQGQPIRCTRNQIELTPRSIVDRILAGWVYDAKQVHHDIWYSVRAHYLGIPILLKRVGWKNIPDNVGLWNTGMPPGKRRPAFFIEREQYFQQLMKDGL
jgi:hypothetical protein